MSKESFYNEKDPEKAMSIYLDQRNNLYEKTKEMAIRSVLLKGHGSLHGKSILEIGAGGGIFTAWFLNQGARVTCVDICEPILSKSKELYPDVAFKVGDATSIKIENGACAFDLVFAKDVIEHIQNDDEFLINMFEHVKPGGSIVLITQNSQCLNYLLQGGYHFLRGNRPWYGWDPTHLRFYNAKSIRKKLEEAGFTIMSWFGSYYFPYRLLCERLGAWCEGRIFCLPELLGINRWSPISKLGWSIGVVASKPTSEEGEK